MPTDAETRRDKRVLRIAVIAFAIIEALAMIPLIALGAHVTRVQERLLNALELLREGG